MRRTLEIKTNAILRMMVFLLLVAFTGLTQTAKAQQYRVTYLDDLGGNSRGNSINDRSWIAGFSLFAGNAKRHAALWRGTSTRDLGSLGGPDRNSNVPWPVKNSVGIISGISQTNTPEPNGERWSCSAFFGGQFGYTCLGFAWQNNEMRPLAPLTGGNNSFATGSNNTGRIVGWAENGVHDPTCVAPQVLQFRPVVWGPATSQIEELPLEAGDTSGAATAINHRGQIVGISGICDQAVGRYTAKHAVLWDDGEIVDLGNLGAELWITPMAINQQGVIVGFGATQASDVDGDFLRAFIWMRKTGMKEIDPLPGHVFSQATGLNERGQVVGSSCDASGACLGFLWQNDVLKNLNDLVPGFSGVIINAQDINERGEITGRAFNPATGKITAFIAVPIDDDSAKNSTAPSRRTAIAFPLEVRQTLRHQRGIASLNR
jgi:probable HAF family extracellular repeat protein